VATLLHTVGTVNVQIDILFYLQLDFVNPLNTSTTQTDLHIKNKVIMLAPRAHKINSYKTSAHSSQSRGPRKIAFQ